MVARRAVLSGAIAAGLAGSTLAASGSALPTGEPQSGSTRPDPETVATKETLRQLVAELRDFRNSCEAFTCPWVDKLRQAQKLFFRVNGKFPDFMDIGVDVWERAYDWHVRTAQPLTITRLADGRYAMAFMLTTLVLRADVNSDFMSVGYDAK